MGERHTSSCLPLPVPREVPSEETALGPSQDSSSLDMLVTPRACFLPVKLSTLMVS